MWHSCITIHERFSRWYSCNTKEIPFILILLYHTAVVSLFPDSLITLHLYYPCITCVLCKLTQTGGNSNQSDLIEQQYIYISPNFLGDSPFRNLCRENCKMSCNPPLPVLSSCLTLLVTRQRCYNSKTMGLDDVIPLWSVTWQNNRTTMAWYSTSTKSDMSLTKRLITS